MLIPTLSYSADSLALLLSADTTNELVMDSGSPVSSDTIVVSVLERLVALISPLVVVAVPESQRESVI